MLPIALWVKVCLVVLLAPVVLVVIVVVRPGAESRSEASTRAAVAYTKVEAEVARGFVRGHELVVHVDLEVLSDMPFVAPYIDVSARCGSANDSAHGFFMKLDGARAHDQKLDAVHLFRVPSLDGVPSRCDLTSPVADERRDPAGTVLFPRRPDRRRRVPLTRGIIARDGDGGARRVRDAVRYSQAPVPAAGPGGAVVSDGQPKSNMSSSALEFASRAVSAGTSKMASMKRVIAVCSCTTCET